MAGPGPTRVGVRERGHDGDRVHVIHVAGERVAARAVDGVPCADGAVSTVEVQGERSGAIYWEPLRDAIEPQITHLALAMMISLVSGSRSAATELTPPP